MNIFSFSVCALAICATLTHAAAAPVPKAPAPLSVRDFGAVGDGVHDDTAALQRAIDAGARSGAAVNVPEGTYLSSTLHLRSKLSLHLDKGALLQGSDQAAGYPVISPTPFGNLPGQIQALLWAEKVSDVAISGEGIIDGGGAADLSSGDSTKVKFRPALIYMQGCHNVRLREVTLRNPSFWTLHLLRCEDVVVSGVSILANRKRTNTDGIDPDGCRNVLIENCVMVTGDDCIVLKSTEGDLCENITVRNCRLASSAAALKLGTESLGEFRNIVMENCVITDSDVAFALYMKDGGAFRNIRVSNIKAQATSAFPLLIDVTPRDYHKPVGGLISDVVLENISIEGPGRALIEGTADQPVENVTLRNLVWNITQVENAPADFSGARKPNGARRVVLNPARVHHAAQPFQIIVVHARNVQMTNVQLDNLDTVMPKRGATFSLDATGVPTPK